MISFGRLIFCGLSLLSIITGCKEYGKDYIGNYTIDSCRYIDEKASKCKEFNLQLSLSGDSKFSYTLGNCITNGTWDYVQHDDWTSISLHTPGNLIESHVGIRGGKKILIILNPYIILNNDSIVYLVLAGK